MEKFFFESWTSVLRSLVITVLAYIILVIFLRVSGKRTLSKMNAFDFIVTIALGSWLATVALNKNVPLADGALVLFLLIFLQFLITWLSIRVAYVKKIVTSTPTLLLYKGEPLRGVMKKERITIEEIYMSARMQGFTSLDDIDAMVLETTGDIHVIHKTDGNMRTMKDISNYPEVKKKV